MPSLIAELDNALEKSSTKRQHKEPVWEGPESNGPQGGITYSLLCRFLSCRERFRLLAVKGLKSEDSFSHRLEYGSMWHVCEENHAAKKSWEDGLRDYAQQLCKRYRFQQKEVLHWYNVCKVQFPIYVAYWRKHKDVVERTPIFQEKEFSIAYPLPSGRTVWIKGKWDSVDIIGKGKAAGIYLQENKTKGDIKEEQIKRQLRFDLQTMMYLTTLTLAQQRGKALINGKTQPILGVRYNVIRRPLSGGKGSITRHKGTKNKSEETEACFYQRLHGIIDASPQEFFMRWKVEITPGDVAKFRQQCLDPILEQLCNWWDWVKGNPNPFNYMADPSDRPGDIGIHWRHAFGIWNPLDDGKSSELDSYLDTGSEMGLQRTSNLFPELKE